MRRGASIPLAVTPTRTQSWRIRGSNGACSPARTGGASSRPRHRRSTRSNAPRARSDGDRARRPRRPRDGVLVVGHDPTLDGTTNGSGAIAAARSARSDVSTTPTGSSPAKARCATARSIGTPLRGSAPPTALRGRHARRGAGDDRGCSPQPRHQADGTRRPPLRGSRSPGRSRHTVGVTTSSWRRSSTRRRSRSEVRATHRDVARPERHRRLHRRPSPAGEHAGPLAVASTPRSRCHRAFWELKSSPNVSSRRRTRSAWRSTSGRLMIRAETERLCGIGVDGIMTDRPSVIVGVLDRLGVAWRP